MLDKIRCIDIENTNDCTVRNIHPEDTVLRCLIKSLLTNPNKTPDHMKLLTITRSNYRDNRNPGRLKTELELSENIWIICISPKY